MAHVSEVAAEKKLTVELGTPFFILVSFAAGLLVFGTLYVAQIIQSSANPESASSIVESANSSIESTITDIGRGVERATEDANSLSFESGTIDALKTTLSLNISFLAFAFFDTKGDLLYELHKSRTPDQVLASALSGNTTYLTAARTGNGAVTYILSEQGNTSVKSTYLYAIVPMSDQDGTFAGMLVAAISADDIDRIIRGFGVLHPAKVHLADILTGDTLLSQNTLSTVTASEGLPRQNMLLLFKNNKNDYGYVDQDNRQIDGSWRAIKGTSWAIVAETLPSGTSPELFSLFTIASITLVILVALVFFYLYSFNRRLLTPLRKIERGMQYYKTGDYSETITVNVKNELASVADLFNSMAHHIENNTSATVSQLKKSLERQNTDTRLLIEKDVELREQGVKLQELDKAKSMFVSVAAHQMRTPLAAIKWALKLVADGDVGPVNPEQKEYLMKGYDSTTRMIDLINDLLDVDKIESDKFSYTFAPEQLDAIVQGIIDDLTGVANEKGVNLIFRNETGGAAPINADKVKLRNALQNLIDNAIKYTIGGGDVTVILKEEQGTFKLSIADTGIGIPRSEQGKVFGKFFRAKNAVRQQTDGSGLGLFIVKKIIEKHEGTITFESKEGKGTTFFITIPHLKTS